MVNHKEYKKMVNENIRILIHKKSGQGWKCTRATTNFLIFKADGYYMPICFIVLLNIIHMSYNLF